MRKIVQLILGIAALVAFVCLVQQFNQRNKRVQQMKQYMEQNDIATDALFYTESPKAVEQGFLMRRAIANGQ